MRRFLLIFLVCVLGTATAGAQTIKDIKINEILVKNVDNYEDDYGHRSSWLEIHNTGHSSIDIGGCYFRATFTDGEIIEYRIPTGDPRTNLGPLGYTVFFCEGTGTKGTFYTNFTMDNIRSIALYNSSGKGAPIDEIHINYDEQLPDISIGRITQEDGSVAFRMLPQTTPNATNDTEPLTPRHERLRQVDPNGGMMALMAISVVLSVLTILFLLFKLLGNYMVRRTRRKTAATKAIVTGEQPVEEKKNFESLYTSEQVAAIAVALRLYMEELHDRESTLLTINRVARAYSPWSSKIYGLRQMPTLKR